MFCKPRDDQFGHYSCDSDGRKICLPGWHGATCENATCKPGCDPVYGSCDYPGDCKWVNFTNIIANWFLKRVILNN